MDCVDLALKRSEKIFGNLATWWVFSYWWSFWRQPAGTLVKFSDFFRIIFGFLPGFFLFLLEHLQWKSSVIDDLFEGKQGAGALVSLTTSKGLPYWPTQPTWTSNSESTYLFWQNQLSDVKIRFERALHIVSDFWLSTVVTKARAPKA